MGSTRLYIAITLGVVILIAVIGVTVFLLVKDDEGSTANDAATSETSDSGNKDSSSQETQSRDDATSDSDNDDASSQGTTSGGDYTIVIRNRLSHGDFYVIEQQDGRWELKYEISADTFAGLLPELHAELEGHFPIFNIFDGNTLILNDASLIYTFKLENGEFIAQQEISHETFPEVFTEDEAIRPLVLDGDRFLIKDDLSRSRGPLYSFRKHGNEWELEDRIDFSDVLEGGSDFFVTPAHIHDNIFVTAADGGIYIFRFNEDQWMMEQVISHETFPEVYANEEGVYYFSLLSFHLHGDRLAVGANVFF